MRSPVDAVAVALSLVGHGVYELGTGDRDTPPDAPSDCAGFAICKSYDLRRHQPGLNRNNPCGIDVWDVEDDWNSNSLLADAYGAKTSFRALVDGETPQAGDLIAYPTIHLSGHPLPWIGHVAIIVDASAWDGTYASLRIVQCRGPDGEKPGIIESSAAHFDDWAKTWPKFEHTVHVVRAVAA